MNRDPIGEGGEVNLYSFVKNRPADKIDGDGRLSVPSWIRWPIAGGGVLAVYMAIDAMWHCDHACRSWVNRTLALARREANEIAAGDSTHNDQGSRADALTHCIASCRLARDPGNCRTTQRALDFLQAREPNRAQDVFQMMDALNNIAGYTEGTIRAGKTPNDCARDCTSRLNAGGLFGVDPTSGELILWPPHEYFLEEKPQQ